MSIIKNIKDSLNRKSYKKKSGKQSLVHETVNFDDAKTIGFIVNITEFTGEVLVDFGKYIVNLERRGKTVALFEINPKRKVEQVFKSMPKSIFINYKAMNWTGIPNDDILKEINNKKVDILLDLDRTESMTAKFISGLCNARCRVGIFAEGFEDFYELMLDVTPGTPISKILDGFEQYTKMIRK